MRFATLFTVLAVTFTSVITFAASAPLDLRDIHVNQIVDYLRRSVSNDDNLSLLTKRSILYKLDKREELAYELLPRARAQGRKGRKSTFQFDYVHPTSSSAETSVSGGNGSQGSQQSSVGMPTVPQPQPNVGQSLPNVQFGAGQASTVRPQQKKGVLSKIKNTVKGWFRKKGN